MKSNNTMFRPSAIGVLLTLIVVAACQSDGPLAPRQLGLASGNSSAAHACQGNGYKDLRRSDGSAFKNAGECTSYAAQGGTLSPAGPVITKFEILGNDCFVTTYVAVFSGGTGTVSGQPVTSGVPFTIIPWYTPPNLTVTSPTGQTVTASAPFPVIDSTCWI